MATTAKRKISKRQINRLKAYIILACIVLFLLTVGYLVGRFTAPKETVTVTTEETIASPTYEPDSLPETEEINYLDIPLSHSLQRYIFEVCADNDVPVSLVIAMIDTESNFNPEVISKSDDYGLMQINIINHDQLAEEYRCADMLDPYQNVFCGVRIIKSYIDKYDDFGKALMAYNMGDYGARKAWGDGITESPYSKKVLKAMKNYEEEVQNIGTSDSGE